MYSLKFARNLQDKKTRKELGMFLVEWEKSILEAIHAKMDIVQGFFSHDFSEQFSKEIKKIPHEIVSWKDIEKVTSLTSNRAGILIVRMKDSTLRESSFSKDGLFLVLDGINDPGNLGTIIRIADWYGIKNIICSPDTVDIYNPKTIMATMGSWIRVQVIYQDLEKFFESHSGLSVYWAFLEGENIRMKDFTSHEGCLVIGSESRGIRPHLEPYITDRITIPRVWQAESLNAWVATAVILERMIPQM